MIFPHAIFLYHWGSRRPLRQQSYRSLPFSPKNGLKGSVLIYLLMIFPHPIFLSEDSVEYFAVACSRHFFVLNEYNVFRDFEAGYLAFTVTANFFRL